MAAINSNAVTGDWATGSTWVGGVPPTAGDTAVIVSGASVTVSTAITVGSKASGVGIGVSVPSGGTLTIASTGTLTPRGFDTTTNNALTVAANGNLITNAGTISVDAPSDWGTIITVNGNLTSVGGIFTIPASNFVWSNASGTHNLGTVASTPWDRPNNIYSMKVNTASVIDSGPISNSAGTALGSFGNTSFTVISGGFDSTTSHEVSSYAGMVTNGDYFMDYNKGFVYYKSSSATLTISFSYKFGTWFSYGIVCQNNATNSAISVTGNTVVNYAGMTATAQSQENSQGGLMIDDKFVPALNAARGLTINGIIFNHCTRPLQIYNTNTSGTATNSANHLVVQNVAFNHCHFQTGSFASGLINHGYTNYVDHTNFVFNTFTCVFASPSRGPLNNITASNWTGATSDGTGHVVMHRILPPTCNVDGLCTTHGISTTSPLIGFAGANDYGSSLNDPCAFEVPGTAGHPNVYSNSFLRCVHRKARMDSWMTVINNFCDRTYHHGTVHRSSNGYISNYIFKGNTFTNSLDPVLTETDAAPGGWTLGYNQAQWIDNVIIEHNTFDGSNRGIQFNDRESTVCLGTRLTIRDNIISNNQQGIRLAPSNTTNITSLALTQVDCNDDYTNSTNVTNINQGTFVMGGVNYNTSGSKTATGCYLFNPSYTLPASANNFVLTVAGTFGTTKSIKCAWGGGTQIEFAVQTTDFTGGQGTATSATNPGGGPATLTNTGAAFPTTGSGLKAYQIIIVSGTGAGQYGMISQNTATVLTIIPNQNSGNWVTTPDATSVYLLIKPHQTLTDASTGTIFCGIHSPELQLTNGTYTDSTITITKGYPGTSGANNGINPTYVSTSDFRPTNKLLANASSDGIYVGALPIAAAAFEADAFENDAFLVTFGGSTYNVSITSSVATGFSESVFLGSFPSFTAAITAAMTASAKLDAAASTTFGIAVTNAVSSILNAAASLGLTATVAITSSGGASYTATITLAETNTATTATSLAAAGILTLPITVTISDIAQLSAVGSVPFPVTTGYSLITQLLLDAATSYSITTGVTDSVTKTAQGAVAFGATTTVSDTAKLDAVASILLTVTEGLQVSLGSIISAVISLATTTGISINTQLLATALVTAAISCGYSMSTKLDAVAQANIATHPLVQATCNALFFNLVQAGISTTLATLVVKQLNAAIVVGVTLGLVENGTLFSFEEGALSAGSSTIVMTLVANTVSVVEKLVAASTQVKP